MNETTPKVIDPSKITLPEFNDLLNEEPKEFETNTDGYKHIPIAFIEHDLRYCFNGLVQFEILQTIELFNSISMNVRIKCFHPIIQQWLNYDGSAAVVISSVKPDQKYKNATTVVVTEDESMGVAIVYSEGIKKAAQRIGVRFGSNLNRDYEKTPAGRRNAYESMPELKLDDIVTDEDYLRAISSGQMSKKQADTLRAKQQGVKVTELKPLTLANNAK